MSETEFETLTYRLSGASIVAFALLALAAFYNPEWGYATAMWAGGMALPLCRWYTEIFKA